MELMYIRICDGLNETEMISSWESWVPRAGIGAGYVTDGVCYKSDFSRNSNSSFTYHSETRRCVGKLRFRFRRICLTVPKIEKLLLA